MKKEAMVVFLTLILLLSIISFTLAQTEYNLTYDANGNLIQGFDKYFEYNGLNELEKVREINVTGKIIAEYSYDHEGNRIKKIEYNSDGTNQTTYYIDKNFVQIINESGVYNETFYYDTKNLVAKKNNDGDVNYYHPDHLGSTTLITNESGDVVEETFYLPYGEIIEGGDSRYLFTGKEKDTDTGLYYYGARYYDSFLRHFTQPDTNIKEIYNPQDLNRYSYTRNNPYKYIDPSGNSPTAITGAIGLGVGASIGALMSIVSQVYSTGQVSWSDVGKSSVIGGVAGGIAGLTLGLGNAAIGAAGLTGNAALITEGGLVAGSGVIGGQAGRVGVNVLEGGPMLEGLGNPTDMAIDAAIALGTFGLGKGYQSAYMSKSWSKATLKTSTQSINYHYKEHITKHGLKMSKLQYTLKAQSLYSKFINNNLPPNAKVNLNHPLKFGKEMGIKITTGKEFGIYTQSGKIVSYQPPRSSSSKSNTLITHLEEVEGAD